MSNLSIRLRKTVASLAIASLLSTFLAAVPVQGAFSDYVDDAAREFVEEAGANTPSSRYEAVEIMNSALDLETCEDELPFTDVPADHSSRDAVQAAFCSGLVFGEGGSAEEPSETFNGDEVLNRAEYVAMMSRALGWADADLPEAQLSASQMAELEGEWYEEYAMQAYAAGVIRGFADEGNVLGMSRGILSQDAAVMACRGIGACETPGDDEEEEESSSSADFSLSNGTEGSLESVELGSPDESEALEGEQEVEIYALDVELDDEGPLELQRLDVIFGADDAGDSTKPWDYFTEVAVAIDGDIVASMDTDSDSDWSDDLSGNLDQDGDTNDNDDDGKEYRLRFTGLDTALESDETTTVSVLVSVMDTIDSADQATEWFLIANEARFMDETGVVTTEDLEGVSGANLQDSFDMDEEEIAQLTFREAEDEVVAQVVQVDESTDTNGVVIYAFEVEEEEGITATLEELTVTFVTEDGDTGDNESNVIKEAFLYADGEEVSNENVTDGGIVTFENIGQDIEADSTVDFEIVVDLKDTNEAARYDEGTTIAVEITSVSEVTDDNGNDEDEIGPLIDGLALDSETHELRTEGVMFEFVSATASATSPVDGESQQGEFEITFTATAFGEDAHMSNDCDDIDFDLTGGGGAEVVDCVLDSPTTDNEDEDDGNEFELDENQTRTFTLNVVVTPDQTGFYKLTVDGFVWGPTSDADGDDNTYTFDMEDYKTNSKSLSFVA
jgi:hypothetical protein